MKKILKYYIQISVLLILSGSAFSQEVKIICQSTINSGQSVPVVLRFIDDEGEIETSINRTVYLEANGVTIGDPAVRVIRGVGSVTTSIQASSTFILQVGGFSGQKSITVESNTDFTEIDGTISSNQTWTKNQVYRIKDNLVVSSNATLTIEEGTRVFLDKDVNIRVNGKLHTIGSEVDPIMFLPYDDAAWGGLEIEDTSDPADLKYTIFQGGGGDGDRDFGHSNSQPVLKVLEAELVMDNCFFIDNEGKGIGTHESVNTITNCVISRCDTGAEFRYSFTTINGLYSMFIPDEDDNIDDNDNDGIYFWSGLSSNTERNLVSNVVIYGVEDEGIDFNSKAQVTIKNAFIAHTYDKGFSTGNASSLEVSYSIFSDCNEGAVGIKDDSHVIIENSTFYKNPIDINCYTKDGGTGSGHVIAKNLIFSKTTINPVMVDDDGSASVSYSLSDTDQIGGQGNIHGDPLFVNADNFEFELTESSPAIDSGDPSDPFDPDGTRRDMGAVPFNNANVVRLSVNEISYRPLIDGQESENHEFFEMLNTGITDLSLTGFYFSGEIQFSFPDNTTLEAGQILLMVKDQSNWTDLSGPIFQWTSGTLNNTGGNISLFDQDGEVLIDLSYSSSYPWPTPSSIYNYTIELPVGVSYYESPANWRLSYEYGGTPGLQNERSEVRGLVINEFMPKNEAYLQDTYGEYNDWIELKNNSNEYINLAGLFLSNNDQNKRLHLLGSDDFDQSTMPPKSYCLLWADEEEGRGFEHLKFTLPSSGGEIVFGQVLNGEYLELDEVYYSEQGEDQSYGRIPDGSGFWTQLETPTPGSQNIRPVDDVLTGLYINEFVARFGPVYPDEFGNFSDWIEIYNSTNLAINLGGLYFSDDLGNLTLYKIPINDPEKTTIPAKGYVVFRADALPHLGALHLNIELASQGETIILSQLFNGTVFKLDEVAYPPQDTDISYGRAPDGSRNWEFFVTPTPGARNSGNSSFEIEGFNSNLLVFPNPAKDSITIQWDFAVSSDIKISVLNQKGQIVKLLTSATDIVNKTSPLILKADIHELENGIYYLLMEADEVVQYKKIIVVN